MTPTKDSLIFLPEETGRPIVRADTAVAYLEAGQPESLGHRMAAAGTMYDRLLDIKRLAESADDSGYEAHARLDLIAQKARAALSAVGATSVRFTIRSSHGELTVDALGYVAECRAENDDTDGGKHLKSITRFDLEEWRERWGSPETGRIDILDLGYWYTDPKTGESGFAPPDAKWRSEIAEILLERVRSCPDEGTRRMRQLRPTPAYTIGVSNDDGECYDICIMHDQRPIATLIAPERDIAPLVHAANAFDCSARKFGINAAGFAERMADGGLAELVETLDYLLTQTVDMDLKYGFTLSEGEADARARALAIIAKVKGIAA